MKKFRTTFIILVGILALLAVIGYGVINSFNYEPITGPFVKLLLSFVEFVTVFIAAPSFAFPEILYLVAIVVGPLLALLFFVSRLIKKDIFGALLGLISPLLFVYALIGLFIPYYPNIPTNLDNATPYFEIFLGDLTTNLTRAIIFGTVFGLTILTTFVIIVSFIFRKPSKKVVRSVPSQPQVTATVAQPASITQTTIPVAPTPAVTSSDQSINELVKLVLAEELNAMRSGYVQPQPQSYAPYPASNFQNYQPDLNLIRRIVVEELAKFQGHFISRPEAQTLIAQEIAMIKAQLKIK